MQHRGEQFGTENESRDPRFAELDAQIKAEVAIRQRRTAPKPKRQRRQAAHASPQRYERKSAGLLSTAGNTASGSSPIQS
jgi:hypothetical protein